MCFPKTQPQSALDYARHSNAPLPGIVMRRIPKEYLHSQIDKDNPVHFNYDNNQRKDMTTLDTPKQVQFQVATTSTLALDIRAALGEDFDLLFDEDSNEYATLVTDFDSNKARRGQSEKKLFKGNSLVRKNSTRAMKGLTNSCGVSKKKVKNSGIGFDSEVRDSYPGLRSKSLSSLISPQPLTQQNSEKTLSRGNGSMRKSTTSLLTNACNGNISEKKGKENGSSSAASPPLANELELSDSCSAFSLSPLSLSPQRSIHQSSEKKCSRGNNIKRKSTTGLLTRARSISERKSKENSWVSAKSVFQLKRPGMK